jgi:hypothetical protein
MARRFVRIGEWRRPSRPQNSRNPPKKLEPAMFKDGSALDRQMAWG